MWNSRLAVPALTLSALLSSYGTSAESPKAVVGPTADIKFEYLMTFFAPLDSESDVDDSLAISNIGASGGWAKGPKINAKFVPPGGDWLRVLPSGSMRIDVRATLKTDDGALIYMSYNGTLKESKANEEKAARHEVVTGKEMEYFVVAPTFETSSPKYSWLNGIQAIGKMVEYREGKEGYVKYDVFVID